MKSVNPTVSVLFPIGKDKRFLEEALESIRNQSFKDYELLSQEDDGRGITQVLIDLAKKAKGEFLVRMDVDDICLPNRFKVQVDYLRANPDVQLAGSWAILIDEKGNQIGLQKMPIYWEEIKREAFFRNPLIHPSWMTRRNWFEKIGGYNSVFATAQDWELILRRVWRERIENIPEPLLKLRIHSGSVSFSKNRLQVYYGLKARLSAILRGDVRWYKGIYLMPSLLALMIPTKLKLLARLNLNRFLVKLFDHPELTAEGPGMTIKPVLGIVMPIGQNKEQLLKSGQWGLWQSEIEEYRKYFGGVEIFEFKHRNWFRFPEAILLPLVQSDRFKRCSVFKAVHLSAVVPCLMVKALYRIPYVLSFGYRYDEFAKIEKKWVQWIFIKLLEPLAIRYADLVLVPTEGLRAYVNDIGAKNIEVIPNGVDVNLFKQASKGLTLRPQGETLLNILFVGRLERQKNLESLIKAVYKLLKGPTLPRQGRTLINKLVFVGAGSLRGELTKLANTLGINLEIIGPVPNEKLPGIYRQADIFVLPSLAEGHPKALLEAMSCGLACIASDITGVNEIIVDGKNGLLVQATVNGLVKGLKRLVGDSKLRKLLGTNARKTVLDRFDKRKLMEKECKLLTRSQYPNSS
ncbi:glycosyltransferase [Candidatus Collierbacteria bacterium]|nr:glycosyltransferase [Candidatus Collierbacteria bacterium]